jgi:hypothetical protein
MLAIAFLRWWYGAGWKAINANVRTRMQRTVDSFSVPTLIRTLFAPWKRIVATPGSGISAHMQAMGDNAVSRVVGFSVRLIVLFTAGISLLFFGLFGIVQVLVWPLVPLLVVAFVIGGVAL